MDETALDPFGDDDIEDSQIFGNDSSQTSGDQKEVGANQLNLPKIGHNPVTGDAMHVRIPFLLGIRHAEFDADNYGVDEFDEEQKSCRDPTLALRWRFKRDESGNVKTDSNNVPMRESNSKLIRKKNGTYAIVVGSQEIDFSRTDIQNSYIFNVSRHLDPASQGLVSFLEGVAKLNHRAILSSSSQKFEAKKKVRKVMTEKDMEELQTLAEQEAKFKKANAVKKESAKESSSMSIQFLEKKRRKVEDDADEDGS